MSIYEIIHVATSPVFAFAIYKLFHTVFTEKVRNKHVEIFSYCCYVLLLSATIFFTRIPLVMLSFNVASLFLLSFNYQSSIQKKIIATSLVYSVVLVIELVVSAAIGFLDISIYRNSTFNSVIGLILIRTITMIAAYLLNRYKDSTKRDYPIPKRYYFAFTVILFGTLYLFTLSLENNNLTIYNVLISGSILILVNITMIIIDEKIYNVIMLNNEKRILTLQNISYENQAEIINQSDVSIKAFRHDMKNHFIALNEMYKNDNKDEIEIYIGKIIEELEKGGFSNSNNCVIDSIINFKLRKLQDVNAKISVEVNAPQNMNILAYDITVISGNLLDNAIGAVLKSENKKIDLRISCSMGKLIILIDNSFDGNLIIENGKFKTTKAFKNNHGIGIANVERSLEHYDGEMRTEYTKDTFSVAVIIPYEI